MDQNTLTDIKNQCIQAIARGYKIGFASRIGKQLADALGVPAPKDPSAQDLLDMVERVERGEKAPEKPVVAPKVEEAPAAPVVEEVSEPEAVEKVEEAPDVEEPKVEAVKEETKTVDAPKKRGGRPKKNSK